MKSVSRLRTAIPGSIIAFLLSACISSAAGSPNRETAWVAGGHIGTRWSVEDAIEQGLSRKVTGEDWHSHQIKLRRSNGQTFRQQVALMQSWGTTICTDAQDSRDWAALKCRAWTHVKQQPPDATCDFRRCTIVQFAQFVLREEGLLATVRDAASMPCDAIPDYRALQERFRTREPRGGITMHTADVSQYWLYCDTARPVRGRFLPTSSPDVFTVRWDRANSSEEPASNNRKEMEK